MNKQERDELRDDAAEWLGSDLPVMANDILWLLDRVDKLESMNERQQKLWLGLLSRADKEHERLLELEAKLGTVRREVEDLDAYDSRGEVTCLAYADVIAILDRHGIKEPTNDD